MLDLVLFAQQAAPTAADAGKAGGGLGIILYVVAFALIFYLLIYLPERRRKKKLEAEIKSLKIGDKVATYSGIVGIVDFVGEKTVYVRSLDAKVEVQKEAIAGLYQPPQTPAK